MGDGWRREKKRGINGWRGDDGTLPIHCECRESLVRI